MVPSAVAVHSMCWYLLGPSVQKGRAGVPWGKCGKGQGLGRGGLEEGSRQQVWCKGRLRPTSAPRSESGSKLDFRSSLSVKCSRPDRACRTQPQGKAMAGAGLPRGMGAELAGERVGHRGPRYKSGGGGVGREEKGKRSPKRGEELEGVRRGILEDSRSLERSCIWGKWGRDVPISGVWGGRVRKLRGKSLGRREDEAAGRSKVCTHLSLSPATPPLGTCSVVS